MASEKESGTESSDNNKPTQEQSADAESLSPDLLIKHPLQNKWSLWFYKNDKTKAWQDNLLEITAFDTVEDFWALFNHIEVASRLPNGCDYSLFKYGIKPMWEDCQNKNGGRWLINLNKNQRTTDLDNYWLETLLCLIGEAFDEFSDYLCGAVVQIRAKGDKLGIWTGDFKGADANVMIGKKLKERLNLHHRMTMGYEAHVDTQTKTGSMVKNRYQV